MKKETLLWKQRKIHWKTKKYAKYYLLLEECIKYYNDYQKILKKKYFISIIEKNKIVVKEKDDKIDILEKKLDILIDNNEQFKKKNNKIEAQLNEALERLELTYDRLDDTKDELDVTRWLGIN